MRNDRPKKNARLSSRADDPLAPPELPGITLTPEPISRGPFSALYRGWDRVHHYDVVVKVLHTTGDPVAADRFRREAAVMAQLRHPSIVALYQFYDGDPSALVMEYVPGQTLDALIGANGWMEPGQAARVIEEIAAALDCIHAENVVHRDVKPSNILLPKHGQARLTDFGVAHIDTSEPLTVRGDLLGTIEYASPEQVKGTAQPDARSDVYSLAAVAYFALTGTPPFRAADNSMQSQLSVMHQQVFSEPPPPSFHRSDLPPGIDAAVLRGLVKDPEGRYPSAGQFASALRSAVVAASGAPEQAAMAVTSRRTTTALSGALAGAALLAGSAFVLWDRDHSAPLPVSKPQPVQNSQLASRPAAVPPAAAHSAVLPVKIKPASRPKPTVIAARPVPSAHSASPVRRIPAPLRVAHALPRQVPRVEQTLPIPMTLVQKKAVIERPRYRRHPALVAKSENRVPAVTPKPQTQPGLAWLAVYAWQANPLLGRKAQSAAVPARWVMVDGKPVSALASGGWAALPAGRHLIAYVPAAQSGFSRNPGLWVTLAPGAHLHRQILLPVESGVPVHPAEALTASAPPAAQPQAAVTPAPAQPVVGWYTVSGWVASSASDAKPTLVRTSAQWVKVDGKPVLSLALGQWAELPAGKHTIEFLPTNGVGVASKTWDIDLAPQAHLDQHIPFAALTASAVPAPAVGWYTVSGWIPRDASAGKPDLVQTSAQWVKVDGKPVVSLALGQWAELSAGKHTIEFLPAGAAGMASKTWDIDLAPQAHLDQHIPFAALTASAVPAPAPPAVGWYTVSGWIARNTSDAKPNLIRTSAQWVKVDGKPVASLALGQWAELPAGKHTITFQPTNGVGVVSKTWDIDLAPQAHLDQHIPLPSNTAASN